MQSEIAEIIYKSALFVQEHHQDFFEAAVLHFCSVEALPLSQDTIYLLRVLIVSKC